MKFFSGDYRPPFDWKRDTNQKQQLRQPAKAAGKNAGQNVLICIFSGSLAFFCRQIYLFFLKIKASAFCYRAA
jgi:hypothetical protein